MQPAKIMSPEVSDVETHWMQRALELARRGQGTVEPNPMVGCVVVREGAVIGEGWHQRYGGPHAEIHALQQAGADAKGAEMYVTLEPCSHQGKTPPCTDAILQANIAHVVAAVRDPNPQVSGQGLQRLREAGLTVHEGCCRAEAAELLAPYWKRLGRPNALDPWQMGHDARWLDRRGKPEKANGFPTSRPAASCTSCAAAWMRF